MEMLVGHCGGSFSVEVKAPLRERPATGCWSGDDSDALQECVRVANRQFDNKAPNVLVVVPELKVSVSSWRAQLVRAFYGQDMIMIPLKRQRRQLRHQNLKCSVP